MENIKCLKPPNRGSRTGIDHLLSVGFYQIPSVEFSSPKPEIRAEGPKDGQERVSEHIQILGARRMVAIEVEIYGWINYGTIYGKSMGTTWNFHN